MVLSIDEASYDLTRPVEVVAGASLELGVLELDASASFSARLSAEASAWLRATTHGSTRWDIALTHRTRPWLKRVSAGKQADEVIEYEHVVPGIYWIEAWPPRVSGQRLIELRPGESLDLELGLEEELAEASARIRLCVDARLTLADLLRLDLYSKTGELIRSDWMDIGPTMSRETTFLAPPAGEYVLEISDGEITYSSTRITSRPHIDMRSDPYVHWITIGDGECE